MFGARGRLGVACLATTLLLTSCRSPTVPIGEDGEEMKPTRPAVGADGALRQVPWTELPLLLDDGERASLRQALARSRGWLSRRPAEQEWVFGPRIVTTERLIATYDRFLGWLDAGISIDRLAVEAVNLFDVFESVGGPEGGMLITGYYEPMIDASLRRSSEYSIPIYRPPPGIVRVTLEDWGERFAGQRGIAGQLRNGRLVPLPERREIRVERPYRGLELAWAKDPVDVFFLEVQGSGTLRLEGGGEMRVGYASSNGRPYRSIGRLLIDEGEIEREKVSMQSIRQWLDAHPEEVDRVLDHNASVVFFRRLEGEPVGSLGLAVTPGRSVATDSRIFPKGALGFLVTEVPTLDAAGRTVAERPLTRFVLNQDTGGAIRGAGRVDFFWGRGEEAAARAGAMKQPGRLVFLVPKEAPGDAEDSTS